MSGTQNPNAALDGLQRFAERQGGSFFQIEAWMQSEITAISPLADGLMRRIEGSRCIAGEEPAVEQALREALNNAVVHGNRMDGRKLVHVVCRCEPGKGISLVVKDQGLGFDPNTVPNPVSSENPVAERGRGIWLMRAAMDEVTFEHGGTEVHMRKALRRGPRSVYCNSADAAKGDVSGTRPSPLGEVGR
jgi:anti-sigma regulatory factor (Ser/Thr protein kinase)